MPHATVMTQFFHLASKLLRGSCHTGTNKGCLLYLIPLGCGQFVIIVEQIETHRLPERAARRVSVMHTGLRLSALQGGSGIQGREPNGGDASAILIRADNTVPLRRTVRPM